MELRFFTKLSQNSNRVKSCKFLAPRAKTLLTPHLTFKKKKMQLTIFTLMSCIFLLMFQNKNVQHSTIYNSSDSVTVSFYSFTIDRFRFCCLNIQF